jgi:hypothetical protein
MSIEIIVFYLVLLDAVVANLIAWVGGEWYLKHFRLVSRFFPMTKGWTAYYLILVLWVGSLVFRN